MANGEKIAVAQ